MASYLASFLKPRIPTRLATNPDDDDDSPPQFPLPGSIQRSKPVEPQINISPPSSSRESSPQLEDDDEDDLLSSAVTKKKPKKMRRKVVVEAGFSQLDWAKLKSSGVNLRGEGVFDLQRVTKDELALHKSKEDAWSSFGGKVYNITPYIRYHPGGVKELMRVAGRDGTELFMKTHSWINYDSMMEGCLVGFLVP